MVTNSLNTVKKKSQFPQLQLNMFILLIGTKPLGEQTTEYSPIVQAANLSKWILITTISHITLWFHHTLPPTKL